MPLVLEICAGGGGQAIGLEAAGFKQAASVEIDPQACATLRSNRPGWRVIHGSVAAIDGRDFQGVDLLAGGVPCPPFSIAGKQLGAEDERDLFPEALRLIRESKPRAVMLENVPGFASERFTEYRGALLRTLLDMGYDAEWRVLNACNFGVPQLRPRFVLVASSSDVMDAFEWPVEMPPGPTVAAAIGDLMSAADWPGIHPWLKRAHGIGPTLVGGSKKHGGPDLGPTRARLQWAKLGVDGLGIADAPPGKEFPRNGKPRLTVRMAARIQGFPDTWHFSGGKTAAYRQIGNALPPPVAKAVGEAIKEALVGARRPAARKQRQLFPASVPA